MLNEPTVGISAMFPLNILLQQFGNALKFFSFTDGCGAAADNISNYGPTIPITELAKSSDQKIV